MVRMVPNSIQFRRSGAEVRLFGMFKLWLPDPYVVLHHVTWLRKRPADRARDGEADFVIVHPSRGALVLEVKGGEMRYDAAEGQWWSQSRDGSEHRDRDPFEQGRQACYDVKRFAETMPGWPRGWGPFGYAVWFPDGVFSSAPLPQMNPEILVDAARLGDGSGIVNVLDDIFEFWSSEDGRAPGRARGASACASGSGAQGARLLVDALAHDVEIRQPLSVVLDEADREIVRLSKEQYRVLDGLSRMRRVSVFGPAGSGKTMLAVEKARRLAAQGMRVLLTCYNRPLADHLKEAVRAYERVEVFGFHELCTRLMKEAGVRLKVSSNVGPAYYEEHLPNALADACATLGPRFDAIIADEAQDFASSWWLPLLTLLEDPDSGVFYVFSDDNQAIYRPPGGLPEGLPEFRLCEDWRNSEPIFDLVRRFYQGEEIEFAGPEGPPLEMLSVAPGEVRRELGRVLHRLIAEGGVPARDVVVLTPHNEHSKVHGKVGAYLVTKESRGAGDVRVSSIQRFKGLESKVVVVCEVDRLVSEDFTRLMYVACSRARTMLVVMVTDDGGAASQSVAV